MITVLSGPLRRLCYVGALIIGTGLTAALTAADEAKQEELGASPVEVFSLKTEHACEPLGIDTAHPRFRWLLKSTLRGQLQTAYQIQVSSSREGLLAGRPDKWDSGKVASDNSVEVVYKGEDLKSAERCFWRVRVWDSQGRATAYSAPSHFEMGLLDPSDWQGAWIAAEKDASSPLFRRELKIDAPVKEARVYIAGLGYYELSVNGNKVGDRVLDPAPTTYHRGDKSKGNSRVLYATYDVTELLQNGVNVFGVMLGRGWYLRDAEFFAFGLPRFPYGDRPCLRVQLNVELVDGRRLTVVSNEEWKTSTGPITYNDLAQGEVYDARIEQPGWDAPGFDAGAWVQAVRTDSPNGRMVAQALPPSAVVQTLPLRQQYTPTSPALTVFNTKVFDFGQNITGWVRLQVQGPTGTRLTMRHATLLHGEDRVVDTRSNDIFTAGAKQTDTYILRGEGVEVWEPRFTLHGFRYVQIHGLGKEVTLQNVEGRVVHTDVETTGTFHCSTELLNRIHSNIHWTLRGSLQGIPQDAADRDERIGWLGDTTFTIEDYLYNFDTLLFWEKWLNDIQDSQRADGGIPAVVPNVWQVDYSGGQVWPSWESTYPALVWSLYSYYGSRHVVETHYANLKKLVHYQNAASKEGLIANEPIGDHMEPQNGGITSFSSKHTPAALTANAHYYANVFIVARCAELLGKQAEAEEYFAQAESIKTAFNRRFFDPQKHIYATGSQTSQALPLEWGLVPQDHIAGVMEKLLADIRRHGMHVTTGIIGTNSLMQTLPRYGAAEVLYELANQTTFPSLGEQVMKGATTVTETYDGNPWSSQNMKMLCSWDKFFHRDLAGIQPLAPGYRRTLIRPRPVGDLKTVKASQKTIRGKITVEWTKAVTSFDLRVSIPAGVEAELAVPRMGLGKIQIAESGTPVWRSNTYVSGVAGLTGAKADAEAIIFQAGSGEYHFTLNGIAQ
jgi:alpha-L-rhamnosidase